MQPHSYVQTGSGRCWKRQNHPGLPCHGPDRGKRLPGSADGAHRGSGKPALRGLYQTYGGTGNHLLPSSAFDRLHHSEREAANLRRDCIRRGQRDHWHPRPDPGESGLRKPWPCHHRRAAPLRREAKGSADHKRQCASRSGYERHPYSQDSGHYCIR